MGVRAQTSGAVKPASDWATRMVPFRSAIARTTMSVYVERPASLSSPGRSTATASCPAARMIGTTRCQYQAIPPDPGTRTNDAIGIFQAIPPDPGTTNDAIGIFLSRRCNARPMSETGQKRKSVEVDDAFPDAPCLCHDGLVSGSWPTKKEGAT
jgi:hypothetical protein